MMWGSIHPVGPGFLPFEGGSGCWILAAPNLLPWNFHSVFMKFASFQYVPQVSNVFPNLFPIALTLCHILCAQFYPKGWDYNISYLFQECSNLDFKNLCWAKQRCWCVVFFLGEILPNFDLKNMILTCTKDFPWKKWLKFARFPIKRFQIIRFLW
jgi:hypothetical protein